MYVMYDEHREPEDWCCRQGPYTDPQTALSPVIALYRIMARTDHLPKSHETEKYGNRIMMLENTTAMSAVDLQHEVASLIVEALNLDVAPGDINPEDPLYGDGLGLDSIDILEVALVVSKRYGLQLRADSEDNHRIFSSLRHLVEYISEKRSA